jgi:hypothetical protein
MLRRDVTVVEEYDGLLVTRMLDEYNTIAVTFQSIA